MAELNENDVRNFKVNRLFRNINNKINAFDFSMNGNYIISCDENERIILYNCQKAELRSNINGKNFGANLIRFADTNHTVLHNSNKIDATIRYLSLNDKKYIHYYAGHVKKVVALFVSPVLNMFVSGSLDETLMFWDLRSPKCEGYVNLFGRPISTISQRGNVLATGINSESLKLFDVRSYDKPYITMVVPDDESIWTDLKFSSNDHSLLLSNNKSVVRLINASNGKIKHTFNGCINNEGYPVESCFSPDSQFIFSGSTNGRIHVWNTHTMKNVCDLRGYHPGPVQCVKFNPKYPMLASACSNLGFWTSMNNIEANTETA